RDLRILLQRQNEDRQRAGQGDDDGDDHRQPGAADEQAGDQPPSPAAPVPIGWPWLGCTLMPSASRWTPCTTTSSPPSSPSVTAQPFSTRAPVSMRRWATVCSSSSR